MKAAGGPTSEWRGQPPEQQEIPKDRGELQLQPIPRCAIPGVCGGPDAFIGNLSPTWNYVCPWPQAWQFIPPSYLQYGKWPWVPHGNRAKTWLSCHLGLSKIFSQAPNGDCAINWKVSDQFMATACSGCFSGAKCTLSSCLVCCLWLSKRPVSVPGSRSLGVTH